MLYTSINGWIGGPSEVAVATNNGVAKNLQPPAEPPVQPPTIPTDATGDSDSQPPAVAGDINRECGRCAANGCRAAADAAAGDGNRDGARSGRGDRRIAAGGNIAAGRRRR